jgi:hypothetical protein
MNENPTALRFEEICPSKQSLGYFWSTQGGKDDVAQRLPQGLWIEVSF